MNMVTSAWLHRFFSPPLAVFFIAHDLYADTPSLQTGKIFTYPDETRMKDRLINVHAEDFSGSMQKSLDDRPVRTCGACKQRMQVIFREAVMRRRTFFTRDHSIRM